jgi:hypothetical protein
MFYFPYFIGLFLGTQIGIGIERTNAHYYKYKEQIINLDNKLKEYERLMGR